MSFFSKLLGSSSKTEKLVDSIISDRLTYLGKEALMELAHSVKSLEASNIEGAIIEAGCALGGSSIVIGSLKDKNRNFYIYDVFGTIPSPSEKDPDIAHDRYKEIIDGNSNGIGGDIYYGYQPSLLDAVRKKFCDFGVDPEQNNVFFVQGLYERTMQVNFPVALAHIDCDWYESVMVCLKQIVPNTISGSLLILDDYYYWPGCKEAVDEFFSDKKDQFEFINKSRLHIRKK